ncbi:kinase-like domain-containing protein [Cytidiella melzeri]|nr:kinase-like domain-containing protein [Cytidiella melzeri]
MADGNYATIILDLRVHEEKIPDLNAFLDAPCDKHSPIVPTLKTLHNLIYNIGHLRWDEKNFRIAWYHLASLHSYLQTYLSKKGLVLHERYDIEHEDIDITDLRYNMRCKRELGVTNPSLPLIYTNTSLPELLECMAQCSTFLCSLAHLYFVATYPAMHLILGNSISELSRLQYLVLRYRTRMQLVLQGDIAELAEVPYENARLLEYVFSKAQREWREDSDWPWNSFTGSLIVAGGPIFDDTVQLIKKEIDQSGPDEMATRDRLRRLLTHILQKTGLTPKCLRVKKRVLDVDSKTQDRMRKKIDPTYSDGRGSYANVYKGYLTTMVKRDNNHPVREYTHVALKCLRLPQDFRHPSERKNYKKKTMLELVSAWTLKHKHVLPLLGVSYDFGPLTLVSPWMANDSVIKRLQDLQHTRRYSGALYKISQRWIGEIADGIDYVHREGIVHGDLRGVNILVDKDDHIKIADFGLALFAEGHDGNYYSQRVGHPLWTAPEIIDPHNPMLRLRPTRQSDIYSFAMVCVELFTVDKPTVYPGEKRPRRPPIPDPGHEWLMAREVWNIVEQCWDENPEKRPSSHALKASLKSIDIGT